MAASSSCELTFVDEDDFLRIAHEDSENEAPLNVNSSDSENSSDESGGESDDSEGNSDEVYSNLRWSSRIQAPPDVEFNQEVVILCTTTAIFGTCMWYFLQTNSRGPLVYVPTVIFACMSSILIMITPNLQKKLTLNDKEVASVIHSVFECLERLSLGALVLLVQLFYPDTNERSIGEYIRVAFPATYGTCIVIPLLVATAFLNSKNSEEGPQLTITVPSPMEGSAQIEGRLPSTHCVDLLGSSPASTPPVDIEQNERRRNSNCAELQATNHPAQFKDGSRLALTSRPPKSRG